MKDEQASGHCYQVLGKCCLPRHTLPCYLFFKMSYNKFLNKINEDLNIYAQNSA